MSEHQWTVVRELIEDALELGPQTRQEFITNACDGDDQLLREVEEYLRYEQVPEEQFSVNNWIDDKAPPFAGPADPGRVGVYRIIRRLGEGGMGVVYLAERDDEEYRQLVALKALKPGPQSARLLHLFRRERQILAQLEHPNIAHLMDGGSQGGHIYYVMEFVDGVPVTTYCNENELSVRQILQLFCKICEAVSYAHRKLIIHRDLKPGNILVTADGTPKLLDFGLAKIFKDSSVEEAALRTTGAMLTPAYASPEQVRGEHLSTASDLYSLGVLLYELLTGDNPQSPEDKSPLEVCRTILEMEPRPPSQFGDSVFRKETVGDIDAIVLMALRKEPERRYGSVEEFRQDVERYLGGFPVHATRRTALYRCRKYVGRHRLSLAVSALVTLLVIGAASMAWWQGREAERRFNDVRSLAHSVIFELHDAVRDLPGSTAARKLIVERALQYLRKLEATGAKKRSLQLEMAAGYQKIGEVQSDNASGSLGDTDGALDSFTQSRRLLSEVLRANPNDSEAEQMLCRTNLKLADVYEQRGEESSRVEASRFAAELSWKLANSNPNVAKMRAAALRVSASNLAKVADWKSAKPLWEQSIEAYKQASAQEPDNSEITDQLAETHEGLAQTCNQLEQLECALEHYKSALEIQSKRLAVDSENTRLMMLVAYHLIDLGWVEHRLGRTTDAITHEKRALALQERIADADPHNSMARIEAAKTLVTTGLIFRDNGDYENASNCLRRAVAVFQSMLAQDPNNQSTLFHLAWSSAELGDVFFRRASAAHRSHKEKELDWAAATASYERSMKYLDELKLTGKLDGLLSDQKLRIAVPIRLAECRRHQANFQRAKHAE